MQLNKNLIKGHKQVTHDSCVPMSVELVLKLEGLMPINDFSFQNDSPKIGNSHWVKNPRLKYPDISPKVIFDREFMNSDLGLPEHTDEALANNLGPTLKRIDEELEAGRYVIISVKSGPTTTHNIVVYNKIDNSNYDTVTFHHTSDDPLIQSENLREKIIERKGTDIITYEFI